MDYYNYHRRKSSIVQIGNTPLGGEYPVRIQSMTNTSTLDTAASVDQCIRIIQAGADYVRLTAQGVREAENLGEIKRELIARGYTTPLVADIHFNPKAADAAAYTVDKVRINPGNFVDSARTFKQLSYTDGIYRRTAKAQREVHSISEYLQRTTHGNTFRSESRFSVGPYHEPLWRYPRRYGGIVYGVFENLPLGKFRQRGNLHQGIKYGSHGTNRSATYRNDGIGRYELSASFGSHRGRRR